MRPPAVGDRRQEAAEFRQFRLTLGLSNRRSGDIRRLLTARCAVKPVSSLLPESVRPWLAAAVCNRNVVPTRVISELRPFEIDCHF